MIKFRITPERFAEACSILDYLSIAAGSQRVAISIAPRFVVDKDGEYVMQVKLDADGDIESFEGAQEALMQMSKVTPKRLEKLLPQFTEAARES